MSEKCVCVYFYKFFIFNDTHLKYQQSYISVFVNNAHVVKNKTKTCDSWIMRIFLKQQNGICKYKCLIYCIYLFSFPLFVFYSLECKLRGHYYGYNLNTVQFRKEDRSLAKFSSNCINIKFLAI